MKAKLEGLELYDKKKAAKRLRSLHMEYEKEHGGNPISALQLVKLIKEKTGISFGGNTYNQHENLDNRTTMSLEILVGLSRFYEVSYDYILGISDTRYPEREDIHRKYGLGDKALNKLENIAVVSEKQLNEEWIGAPSDSDIVNALLTSPEFEALVEQIKNVITAKLQDSHSDEDNARNTLQKFAESLTNEQKNLALSANLAIVTSAQALKHAKFQLQQHTLEILDDVIDNF